MAEVMQAISGDRLDTAMTDQDTLAAFHDNSTPSTSFFNTSTWDWDAVEQTLQSGEEAAYQISSHRDEDHLCHHDGAQRIDTPPQDRVSDMEVGPSPVAEKDDEAADEAEGQQGFDEADHELPRRELRSQPKGKRAFATTWIDNDETGNYDPEEEKRAEGAKRAKLRAINQQRLQREFAEEASDEDLSDDLTEEFTSEASEPARLVVPLTFRSQQGKAAFTELLSKLAAQEHSEKAGYKLRRRSKHAARHPGSKQYGTNEISTEIDLTAKPFARGCWGCTATGTCSLLHDERTWPCETCFEDDMDCEPIVPPLRKRACEMCKRRKVTCSYTYTRKHGAACEQCERVGQRCVAGPVKEFIKPRISYDRDWEADPLPKRRGGKQKELEDCLECVNGRTSCSYPTGSHGSPCEGCVSRGGLPCTIASSAPADSASPGESLVPAEDAPVAESKTSEQRVTSTDVISSRDASRNIDQAGPPDRTTAPQHQLQKPKGTNRKIYTSFSHPIVFNCDLEGGGEEFSCHFCTEPALPKLGFGLIRPEVVDWSDGRGFSEVKGGHIEVDSIEKTRLCYSCTSSRLAIVTCYCHRMRAIASQASGQRVDSCHVCDGSATYECTPSSTDGCGLKMCHPCAVVLSRDHGGYLGKMLGTLADKPEDPEPRTLRADGEFLKEDGHIARYLKSLDT